MPYSVRSYAAGTCTCYAGFTGATCELSLNHVPVLREIPQNGSCDIQTRPCQETPVQGDYFIKSEKLSCTIKSYAVWHPLTQWPVNELSAIAVK